MEYRDLFSHSVFRQAKKVVLFCNQTAYDHEAKHYLFDLLLEQQRLYQLLLPEHGLFSELQDQDSVENTRYKGVTCFSMYNKQAGVTGPREAMLDNADALVIDIQDAGVRFFTYTTHMFELILFVGRHFPDLPVFIMDRPNPAGKKVEGTQLPAKYKSFLGFPGMIHRHGMSIRELCVWRLRQENVQLSLHFIGLPAMRSNHAYISPSPNLPVRESLDVYSGQCFWEATTFSEGRGTTRPFILFGHPDLSMETAEMIAGVYNKKFAGISYLRPLKYIPVFHKHAHSACTGWQLHVEDVSSFHSIWSTLWIMRSVAGHWQGEFWREGSYEFDSTCTAAQLLLGDDDLIDFVNGKSSETDVLEKLTEAENSWIQMNGIK